MKVQSYLALTGGILLFGTLLGNYYQNKERSKPKDPVMEAPVQQRFEERAIEYASLTLAERVTDWQTYTSTQRGARAGRTELIVVEGLDNMGRLVFKTLFDKETAYPLRIMCFPRKNIVLQKVSKKSPRDIAAWWLKRMDIETEGKWSWVRDGTREHHRYLSYWRNNSCTAILSVNTKTGYLVTLGLNPGDRL